jgi:hypothetical protein
VGQVSNLRRVFNPPADRLRHIWLVEQAGAAGKRWIDSLRSLAIRVRSVIVPHTPADFNILLSPLHDAWTAIEWQRRVRATCQSGGQDPEALTGASVSNHVQIRGQGARSAKGRT